MTQREKRCIALLVPAEIEVTLLQVVVVTETTATAAVILKNHSSGSRNINIML